jgi:hypothetical protein
MSLTHIRRIGLPLVAAAAACAAAVAPAVAAPGVGAGTGSFKTWAEAQHAAGFGLLQPRTTYNLRPVGQIGVATCEASMRKRNVIAAWGSAGTSLQLQQNNSGKACTFPPKGTRLGTYKVQDRQATMYGYCGFGTAPSCKSAHLYLWLIWTDKGNYYLAASHDETRDRLAHFAAMLKKV